MSKLPEDGAEAPKHEGAFLIYIYIYIYMCVCVCVCVCVCGGVCAFVGTNNYKQ